jgi:hypothetical protein
LPDPASPDEVVAAGELWCRLVSDSESGQLEDLVTDDFTCRRADGTIEARSEWLEGLTANPRKSDMTEPTVWLFGSVAVLTFLQRQTISCSFTYLQEHGVAMEPGVNSPDELTMLADLESLQVWNTGGDQLTLASHEEWLAYG